MKYGYLCKKCGHNVLSDNKDDIRKAREAHRARYEANVSTGMREKIGGCAWKLTPYGTKARPALADRLTAHFYEHKEELIEKRILDRLKKTKKANKAR